MPQLHQPSAPRREKGRRRGPRRTRVLLVYNPHANCLLPDHRPAGLSPEAWLRQLLQPLNYDVELLALDADSLRQLPARLAAARPAAVWVAGGDGSVLAVSRITRRLDLPLGVIPAGTMNLLARDLGMSLNLPDALQQLARAEVSEIDVAEVNGHPFLCISNLGLSTRFSQLREQRRHVSAWRRWPFIVYRMIKSLFDYPPLRFEIRAEGQNWRVKSRSISISNNPLGETAGMLPSRPRLDSGSLAVYVTRERSVWSLPRLYARLMRGRWKQDPELICIESNQAELNVPRRRSIRLMLDGELKHLSLPLRYRLQPRVLKILRPVPPVPAEVADTAEACP